MNGRRPDTFRRIFILDRKEIFIFDRKVIVIIYHPNLKPPKDGKLETVN